MSITVRCECGQAFAAKDEFAGRRAKCPKCGATLTIPKPAVDDEYGLADDEPASRKPAAPAAAAPPPPPKPGARSSNPAPPKKKKAAKQHAFSFSLLGMDMNPIELLIFTAKVAVVFLIFWVPYKMLKPASKIVDVQQVEAVAALKGVGRPDKGFLYPTELVAGGPHYLLVTRPAKNADFLLVEAAVLERHLPEPANYNIDILENMVKLVGEDGEPIYARLLTKKYEKHDEGVSVGPDFNALLNEPRRLAAIDAGVADLLDDPRDSRIMQDPWQYVKFFDQEDMRWCTPGKISGAIKGGEKPEQAGKMDYVSPGGMQVHAEGDTVGHVASVAPISNITVTWDKDSTGWLGDEAMSKDTNMLGGGTWTFRMLFPKPKTGSRAELYINDRLIGKVKYR